MRAPVIGITTSMNERECLINRAYMEAVRLGGGIPVMLPVMTVAGNICEDYLEAVDGILFSGGTDILPAYFGEFLMEGYEMPYELTPERDMFEIVLFLVARTILQPYHYQKVFP